MRAQLRMNSKNKIVINVIDPRNQKVRLPLLNNQRDHTLQKFSWCASALLAQPCGGSCTLSKKSRGRKQEFPSIPDLQITFVCRFHYTQHFRVHKTSPRKGVCYSINLRNLNLDERKIEFIYEAGTAPLVLDYAVWHMLSHKGNIRISLSWSATWTNITQK